MMLKRRFPGPRRIALVLLSTLVLMAPLEARSAEQIQRVAESQAIELLTKAREIAKEVTEDEQHDSLLSDIAHDLPIVH
jgi:hypothetical protein